MHRFRYSVLVGLSFLGLCSCRLAPTSGANTHIGLDLLTHTALVGCPKISLAATNPSRLVKSDALCLLAKPEDTVMSKRMWWFAATMYQLTNTNKLSDVVLTDPLRDFSVSHRSLFD